MPLPAGSARRLAWLLIGILIGSALFLALPEPARRAATTPIAALVQPAARSTEPVRSDDAEALADDAAPDASSAPAVSAATLAIEFGGDLHPLAQRLLPQALAGDAEAQHQLATVVAVCDAELKRFAGRAELDEFLAGVPARQGIDPERYAELQRDRFEACDGFRAEGLERFGGAADWTARAAAAGHPLATLEQEMRGNALGFEADLAAQRRAALAALESRRPEAFMQLLELEFPDGDGPDARDATPNAVAWWLMACTRGYPCGAEARWRREQVAFRGGQRAELGWEEALLFDLDKHQRVQAQERAAELGRLLDAGDHEAMLPLTLRDAPP